MTYRVVVDDNFHYMDESERMCSVSFLPSMQQSRHPATLSTSTYFLPTNRA
jgi:hypothetical protein